MKRLNICIDIDATLTEPYYWLDICNEYFNKNIKPYEITQYSIYKVMGVSREEYFDFYNKYKLKIHTEEKVRKDGKAIVNRISKYNNIFFVTAREKSLELFTEAYLTLNKVNFDGLYVLGSHHKVDKARELNCDIFIEDNPNNAIELSEASFKVLLMDTYYNREIKENEFIKRVYNWNQIYDFIEEMKFNQKVI
ncbi:5' nucleotidase, NT5C type [Clostridium oceanicum]|uniref:Nucleotidase n=1 Tax=Clostridium oceanicum TaxID=1543 RepID=A0ABP3UNP7_9CLOT